MASDPLESPHQTARSFLQRLSEFWTKGLSIAATLVLIFFVVHAFLDASTPVTTVAPFQIPQAGSPFTGEILADTLQDSLALQHSSIESGGDRKSYPLRGSSSDMSVDSFAIQHVEHSQEPQFDIAIKGFTYAQLVSLARAIRRTETKISGDLIIQDAKENKRNLVLVARASNGERWESAPHPISSGLKEANQDLARKILDTTDLTFAGVAKITEGEFAEGVEFLQKASERDPSDWNSQLNLCTGYSATRRFEEAIKCYGDLRPTTSGAQQQVLERKARAYFLDGNDKNRDEAIQIYEALLAAGNSAVRLDLGAAKEAQLDFEGAIDEYDKALAQHHSPREMAIAHLGKSVVWDDCAALADSTAAADVASLAKCAALLDKSADRSLAQRVKKLQYEALREAEDALRFAPGDLVVLAQEGRALADAKHLDDGIALLRLATREQEEAKKPVLQLQLGKLLLRKGDVHGAFECFQQAAKQRNYREAHLALADAATQLGRIAEAIEEYGLSAKQSGIDLDRAQSDFLAREWTANALREHKKYADAAAMYHEALMFRPNDGDVLCALAFIKENMGNVSQAIQGYREILKEPEQMDVRGLTPEDVKENRNRLVALVHRQLGQALLGQGETQWPSGIEELRQAVEWKASNDPDYGDYVMALGDGYYNMHRFTEAAAEYREVISAASNSKDTQATAQEKLHQAVQREKLRHSGPAA